MTSTNQNLKKMKYETLKIPSDIFDVVPRKEKKMRVRLIDGSKGDNGIELTEDGILVYWKDYDYPQKGLEIGFMVLKINVIKRVIVEFFQFAKYFLPFLLFVRKKTLLDLIGSFNRIAQPVFGRTFLKKDYYCKSGKEIYRAGGEIITEMGDDERLWELLKYFCHMWEFDRMYRYIGQDLLGELNQEELNKNPRKELLRIIDIGIKRTKIYDSFINRKWKKLRLAVKWGMILRKDLFKELIMFLKELNLQKVKLDDGDYCHCIRRINYNFKGKSIYEKI